MLKSNRIEYVNHAVSGVPLAEPKNRPLSLEDPSEISSKIPSKASSAGWSEWAAGHAQPHLGLVPDGTVTWSNEAARALYRAAPGTHLCDLPWDDTVVENALAFCARTQPVNLGGVRLPASATLVGKHARSAEPFLLSLSLSETGQLEAHTSEMYWGEAALDLLRDSFGLTCAELEVLVRLVQGRAVRAIATERGTSYGTVRAQIKTISAKTGAPTQTGLVRLCLGLLAMQTSP